MEPPITPDEDLVPVRITVSRFPAEAKAAGWMPRTIDLLLAPPPIRKPFVMGAMLVTLTSE